MDKNKEAWQTKDVILTRNHQLFIFKENYTLEEIKEKIIENFIPLCDDRECQQVCYLYKRDFEGNPCMLAKRVMKNYINITANFVKTENKYHVEKYLLSVLSLIELFLINERLKTHLTTDWGLWYWKAYHLSTVNYSSFALLNSLNEFIQNFNIFFNINEQKKYYLLVEGKTDKNLFEKVSSKYEVYFDQDKIISIGGEDSVKALRRLKFLVQDIKDQKKGIFVIVDGLNKEKIKKYKEQIEPIISRGHFKVWEKEIEDSLPLNSLYETLKEIIKIQNICDFKIFEKTYKDQGTFKKTIRKISSFKNADGLDYERIKKGISMQIEKYLDKDKNCEFKKMVKDIYKIQEEEIKNDIFLDPKSIKNPFQI
ncbi:MAG: hypothetical protein PHI88_01045 [Candidatus Pacebacteria bacterium]|nr:hypothetical protein [Candidatus Paceibacterota bacterium]